MHRIAESGFVKIAALLAPTTSMPDLEAPAKSPGVWCCYSWRQYGCVLSGACRMTGRRKLQDSIAYPPRAMKADRAAAYLDMSRSKFLELVEADRLPKPKIIDGIRVWDRLALDSAFNDFPERGGDDNLGRRNTFDDVLRG